MQPGLFDHTSTQRNNPALMQAVDALNNSGRGKVWFGSQGIKEDWRMRRAYLSPAYTTRWEDIPVVT
jgi:DNA polymerase V